MSAYPATRTAGLRRGRTTVPLHGCDEHERDLSLPCLACTGEKCEHGWSGPWYGRPCSCGRLHSCEDFPLNGAARALLADIAEYGLSGENGRGLFNGSALVKS